MNIPSKYRLGVGVMLLNAEGRVFVGQRSDSSSEAWQMPQGGIDEGEDPRSAVFREMLEEIGTKQARIITETAGWIKYDLPLELIPTLWNGQYRGQMQKWYLMRLDGDDDLININTEHPEFQSWQWVAPETLPEMIVPFKKELYLKLIELFSPHF